MRPSFTGPTAASTLRKLVWAYGAKRVERMIAGLDDATNEDLASWRRLWDAGSKPLTRP